jgi:hypothetical protein
VHTMTCGQSLSWCLDGLRVGTDRDGAQRAGAALPCDASCHPEERVTACRLSKKNATARGPRPSVAGDERRRGNGARRATPRSDTNRCAPVAGGGHVVTPCRVLTRTGHAPYAGRVARAARHPCPTRGRHAGLPCLREEPGPSLQAWRLV